MFKSFKKQETTEPVTVFQPAEEKTEPVIEKRQEEIKPMEMTSSNEISTLTEDVIITGDIQCNCNLNILGTVNGNVRCGKDLFIKGTIKGNITADNIEMHHGTVQGNVDCEGSLTMDRECSIKGDVKADECLVDGKIIGNLLIQDTLHVQKNAWIEGDISARQFSVLPGAHLESRIVMLPDDVTEETAEEVETLTETDEEE